MNQCISDYKKMTTIAIDFDGTVVSHKYPFIGDDIGAIKVLKELIANGNKIILFTMRSGKELDQAVEWFKNNDIPLYGINKHPTQDSWTSSNKCHAEYCIDDRNIGTPLINDNTGRPCVDWKRLRSLLIQKGLISWTMS